MTPPTPGIVLGTFDQYFFRSSTIVNLDSEFLREILLKILTIIRSIFFSLMHNRQSGFRNDPPTPGIVLGTGVLRLHADIIDCVTYAYLIVSLHYQEGTSTA